MTYRIGSLFAGIGGLDLGLERAGVGRTAWQCEIDPFARSVLARHWPDALRFEDVRELGRTVEAPPVDVLCGGFPCQDLSSAGKRAGITGERSGLFGEIVRLADLLRPRFVVLENVAAIVSGGWGGDDEADRDVDGGGLGEPSRGPVPAGWLGPVLGALAASGYDAWWDCVPARAVGAPHQRDRWFCVAWRADVGDAFRVDLAGLDNPGAAARAAVLADGARRAWSPEPGVGGAADGLPAGMDGARLTWPTPTVQESVSEHGYQTSRGPGGTKVARPTLTGAAGAAPGPGGTAWPARPVEPWERGIPRTVTPPVGLDRAALRAWHKTRKARLRCLGNAVVPQVGEVIGLVLLEIDARLRALEAA